MTSYMQNKPDSQLKQKSQEETVLKNFNAKNDVNMATPALDEFCKEYFRSAKDSKPAQQKGKEDTSSCSAWNVHPNDLAGEFEGCFQQGSTRTAVQDKNLPDTRPPALRYFYHDDARIRMLVQERLQHFVPIGAERTAGNVQRRAEIFNHINHFEPTGAASADWITPNKSTSVPTDAGKRRVQANSGRSGQPGHWFTGDNGRKVYVTKNGQELTGRAAYRQYKKESGAGFRKSKKQDAAKTKKESGSRTKGRTKSSVSVTKVERASSSGTKRKRKR